MGNLQQRLIHLRVHFFEDIRFPLNIGPVNTKDRIEGAKLIPSQEKFAIGRILLAAWEVVDEEAADILSPPGIAGHRYMKPAGHLRLQRIPTGRRITRPGCGGITLGPCPGRTRQRKHSLVVDGALTFVGPLRGHQRIGIQIT